MPTYFVDSSALVKRYRNEPGSAQIASLMKIADRLLISRLTIVEVSSSLVRRARSSKTAVNDLYAALRAFDLQIEESMDVLELDSPVMESAVRISRKYGLRGADAIQLACALLIRDELLSPIEFSLVSADDELNAAATAEGLRVENPNSHV